MRLLRAPIVLLFAVLALGLSVTSAMGQMIPVSVQADRVLIGSESIQRRLDLPSVLTVPAGTTVTLADGTSWDYIEVFGTLKVSRTHDTTARVTTLIIMPGGTLDLGKPADPIPANVRVDIQLRDVPIDLSKDPFQWGNGIANFGNLTVNGSYRTPAAPLSFDAQVGSTVITLAGVPSGWQVGDELIFPSTKPSIFPEMPLVEPQTFIQAINGTTVVLSRGLSFAHETVLAHDGRVAIRPEVVNITRNVVIRSENPLGTPGHLANIGDTACWDAQGVSIVGLGRTTVDVLDNTSADLSHLGTNQVGRYAFHAHHVHGGSCSIERRTVDMVLIGQGRGKWGHVTHGTHDTLIQETVAYGFQGAGIVSEDGYEVRNRWLGNIAINNINTEQPVGANNEAVGLSPKENRTLGKPGTEGSGFWFAGFGYSTFDRNEAWGNTFGFNLFNELGKTGAYPSTPGGPLDTQYSFPYDTPPWLLVDRTTVVGNRLTGAEVWGAHPYPNIFDVSQGVPIFNNLIAVNNALGFFLAPAGNGGDNDVSLVNPMISLPIIWGDFSTNGNQEEYWHLAYAGACVEVTTGYISRFDILGGYLSCATGHRGRPNGQLNIYNVTFDSAIDIDLENDGTAFYNPNYHIVGNTFIVPYVGGPHGPYAPRIFMAGVSLVWDGTGPQPSSGNAPPPPPPPPPPPTWTTVPGILQLEDGTTNQFRLCPDTTGLNCVALVAQ
jgi:hypothetical protein